MGERTKKLTQCNKLSWVGWLWIETPPPNTLFYSAVKRNLKPIIIAVIIIRIFHKKSTVLRVTEARSRLQTLVKCVEMEEEATAEKLLPVRADGRHAS